MRLNFVALLTLSIVVSGCSGGELAKAVDSLNSSLQSSSASLNSLGSTGQSGYRNGGVGYRAGSYPSTYSTYTPSQSTRSTRSTGQLYDEKVLCRDAQDCRAQQAKIDKGVRDSQRALDNWGKPSTGAPSKAAIFD